MLADAFATLSAGQACEGTKTASTQKVATAHVKAQSKINRDDNVTVFDGQKHDEGEHAGHRHARTWHRLNALTNFVEQLNGLKAEAESPCGVSIVRGENLMIQTQAAKARFSNKKLSMEIDMTITSDQITQVKELGKTVKDQVRRSTFRSLDHHSMAQRLRKEA